MKFQRIKFYFSNLIIYDKKGFKPKVYLQNIFQLGI